MTLLLGSNAKRESESKFLCVHSLCIKKILTCRLEIGVCSVTLWVVVDFRAFEELDSSEGSTARNEIQGGILSTNSQFDGMTQQLSVGFKLRIKGKCLVR